MTNKTGPETFDNTFIIDLDGTVLKHLTDTDIEAWIQRYGDESHLQEKILPNVREWFDEVSPTDKIIFLSARKESYRDHTERVLELMGLRYDLLILEANSGPRIVINDIKPKEKTDLGYDLHTAYAVNIERNKGFEDVEHCYL